MRIPVNTGFVKAQFPLLDPDPGGVVKTDPPGSGSGTLVPLLFSNVVGRNVCVYLYNNVASRHHKNIDGVTWTLVVGSKRC